MLRWVSRKHYFDVDLWNLAGLFRRNLGQADVLHATSVRTLLIEESETDARLYSSSHALSTASDGGLVNGLSVMLVTKLNRLTS